MSARFGANAGLNAAIISPERDVSSNMAVSAGMLSPSQRLSSGRAGGGEVYTNSVLHGIDGRYQYQSRIERIFNV